MDASVRRALFALTGAAALLSACHRPAPGRSGTITGQVVRAPTCPVQRVGENCTAPVPGVAVTVTGTNARATTDAEGRFTLRVAARGAVTLHVDPKAAGAMRCNAPTVTPVAGGTVEQNIDCDTGIR